MEVSLYRNLFLQLLEHPEDTIKNNQDYLKLTIYMTLKV